LHAADSASDLKILVGLGNPGGEYANTRHNLGTQFINLLADQNGIVFDKRHRHAIVGSGEICGNKVVLAKLKTYMNDSGNGITFLLNHYSASPSDMTIICDDMDLACGKFRIRPCGGSGGHNGLRSVISAAGTQDFSRIRIGIGRPPDAIDPIEHVLSNVSPESSGKVLSTLERATNAATCMIKFGIDIAMNKYN